MSDARLRRALLHGATLDQAVKRATSDLSAEELEARSSRVAPPLTSFTRGLQNGAAGGGIPSEVIKQAVNVYSTHKRITFQGSQDDFEHVERSVAAKGAHDPKALTAWIGRKTLGKKEFQRRAAEGRKED